MKPGEGMKGLKTNTNHLVKKKFSYAKIFYVKRHSSECLMIILLILDF